MIDDQSDAELLGLLSQLTLTEKISMLSGKNVWETANIDRLGIPSLKVTDGPNGARGGSFFDGTTAACFPACVSLAATFNRDLSRRIGVALAQEAQTKGAYVLLGPTVCGHRSPLGGRNFESFSEDPFLAGVLASEYVLGLQSERVGATVKHFVANEQDTRRFSVNEKISERALREIYLRPFEIVVRTADPWCIMSSYPKVNGAHIDAQSTFLQDILRQEWGFEGLVMSDWGATSNATSSIRYGLDLEMPGPPNRRKEEVVQKAINDGTVSVKNIDHRTLSVLKLLKRTGKFTDRRETPKEEAISRPDHETLIREAGAEGIVLLKNSGGILPLNPEKCRKIALVGPLAQYASAHGGGSASLNCHYKVNPYDAFQTRLGERCDIRYSKGTHIFRVFPDLETGAVNRNGSRGFIAEFFRSKDLSGTPFYEEEYPRGSFTTLMNTSTVGAQSARFSTKYNPPSSGKHYLSFSGLGPSKMFINGELVSHQVKETKDSMGFLLGVQDEHRFQYDFDSNNSYNIIIESIPSQVNNSELFLLQDQISVHVGLVDQVEIETDLLAEAVALARDADVTVCIVGNTAQWETEGQDMASMTLPADGSQDKLVAEVVKANPNTIVVIATGVPVELPWLDQVPAVLQAWYGGQESGNAILDVLLGAVNPSGRLPVSWPRKYEHTACYGNFGLDSYDTWEVDYVEGVNVGYRHFDRLYGTDKEVLFPFGFGLSYSTFEFREATVVGSLTPHEKDCEVSVTVWVKNTSSQPGAEVVQLYLSPPEKEADGRPFQSLVAFEKVFLQPQQERHVSLAFRRDGAAYWVDKKIEEGGQVWRVDSGRHQLVVSTSSSPKDVKARCILDIQETFDFEP